MSDKPIVYEDEDSGLIIYRASALGGGKGALVAARMGYDPVPPPKWLEKIFKQSGALEDDILEMWLEREDSPYLNPEDFEREPTITLRISDQIYVIGHCDALTKHDEDGFGIEIKALGKDYTKAWIGKGISFSYIYMVQLSVYMHATGLPFYFVVYDKEEDVVRMEYLESPPLSLEEIERIVLDVEAMAENGDMPKKCGCSGGYCPYVYLHEDDVEVSFEGDENLDALVEEYNRCREAEKRKKELGKKIAQALESRGDRKVETVGYRISMVEGKGKSLDRKKLEEYLKSVGVDIEEFEREYVYEYPRVTVRKGDSG